MSFSQPHPWNQSPFKLEYPLSLGTYDDYAKAQKAVDLLSDNKFPVENIVIVGTDLKQTERVLGRLSYGRVAVRGLVSGAWFGLFIGVLFTFFGAGNAAAEIVSTVITGALVFLVFELVRYASTGGQRDFASVTQVVATKYEVLVEHKFAEQARQILSTLPGPIS